MSAPQDEPDVDGTRADASARIERELVMLFRRLRAFHVAIADEVHPGLDPSAYGLLGIIHDSGEPLRGADLVERLSLDKSTISRQIGQLVEAQLVERVVDPEDARARRIRLTDLGIGELTALRTERSRRLRERFADWETAALAALAEELSRISDAL